MASFDVFETLIARSVSPHQEIFDRTGRAAQRLGLLPCSPHAFGRAREAAEGRAHAARGYSTNLLHIYAEVAWALSLATETASAIMRLEMEEEAACLRPLETGRRLLAERRMAGDRIVFVSDMYLPSAFIQQQLERHGFWQSADSLYVSHHEGCSKVTGQLFRIVAAAQEIQPEQLTHYGNHNWIDVGGARKAGAKGVLVPAGNPNRYEHALEAHRHQTDGFSAMLAGASRLARTSVDAATPLDKAQVEIAAGVLAPTLATFVLWCFRQAELRGLKTLYFVSRDGEILLHIAKRLAARMSIGIELRYLYASRFAWNSITASPSRNPQVWHSLMWLSAGGFTNKELLERAGLSSAEIEQVVAAGKAEDWNSMADRRPLEAALEQLEADGTLARCAERSKELVLGYLEQEGLFAGQPHAIVDVGWRGTQHDVVIDLQRERGAEPAHGLFFGLEASKSPWGHLRHAYYFDARALPDEMPLKPGDTLGAAAELSQTGGHRAQDPLYALFETFCAGREGSLHRYRREAGRIVPVTDETRAAEVAAWNLDKVYETAGIFAEHLAMEPHLPSNVDARPALADVIKLLWTKPTRNEAEVWGGFPWELGEGSSRCSIDFAPPFSLAFPLRRFGFYPKLATQWRTGSRIRSGLAIRAAQRGWQFLRVDSRTLVKRTVRPLRQILTGLAARTRRS